MAHEIENMMYVGETPWHGLGVSVSKAPSVEEAIKLAGLDWKVNLAPLFTQEGTQVTHRATMRDSDRSILGVVGPGYTPVQNEKAFEFFNPFVQSGEAELETAGSLREGRRIWVLAKIAGNTREVVPGDPVEHYVMLSNSHDGTTSVQVGFTPIRVVCANTLAAAHNDARSTLLRIRHTRNVEDTLDAVRDTMAVSQREFQATMEQYKLLARKNVAKGDIEKYVKIVFYKDKDLEKQRTKARYDEMTNTIKRLFETGRGNDLPQVRGTFWALYNATTEYLSYEYGKTQDARLSSLWFGENVEKNEMALKVAVSAANYR